ncbi:MAG: hypothetical protein SGBAC_012849, partial [Bacillariaceae sp.]
RVDAFYEKTGVKVEVSAVGSDGYISAETIADATAKVYDGYFFLPEITGEVVELGGFADLTQMIPDIEGLDWTDIMPFTREHQAVYDNKITSIPCDSDQFLMYYRKDLFSQHDIQPPRTWDEFTEVAEFFHGMEVPAIDGSNETQVLSGSCVVGAEECSWMYGSNLLVHASTVQANGTNSGILFDPKTSEPLLGKAFAETLRHLENLDKVAHPDVWNENCYDAVLGLTRGTCPMGIYYGNFFSGMLSHGFDMSEKLGVSSTPGSTRVLDRETGELVSCTPEICPYAVEHPDIGLVNTASFAASGGWSAAVSNNASPKRQKLMADFMGFVCGKEGSGVDVFSNPASGTDPFRKSHRNIEAWTEQGYPLNTTIQYMNAVKTQLESPNLALDTRFPRGSDIAQAVFSMSRDHLLALRAGGIANEETRLAVADKLAANWAATVQDYDLHRPASALPFHDVYKKSYGEYIPPSPSSAQSLGQGLIAGIAAGSVLIVILGLWTFYLHHRNKKIAEEKRIAEEKATKLKQLQVGYDSDDSDIQTTNVSEDSSRDEVLEIKKLITSQAKVINVCRGILSFTFLGVSAFVVTYIALGETFEIEISTGELAGVASALFVVVSAICILCFWLEDKRATILMDHAARSNAVVTNMFPGELREQVLGDDPRTNALATQNETLDQAVVLQQHGLNNRPSQDRSKPIADLYLEASVITVNTTARIESTGLPRRIHVSEEFAQALTKEGRENWLEKRIESVSAKGKGELETYWLVGRSNVRSVDTGTDRGEDGIYAKANKSDRLVDWNVELFLDLIRKIVAVRKKSKSPSEIREIIHLPEYDSSKDTVDPKTIEVPDLVVEELRDYSTLLRSSALVLSVGKMLSRIIAPANILHNASKFNDLNASLHDQTYGITSDPLMQFACAFSALIHDVDHRGIGNPDLIKEDKMLLEAYGDRSVAEQNSFELSWHLLMEDHYINLREYVFQTQTEIQHFRQLVVNSVMATDIMDKELKAMRNGRWDKAFKDRNGIEENQKDAVDRKATIVVEHLIQASDVSHTMQHWHVYLKWNECLFKELYTAFKAGRSKSNPVDFWAKGEIGFFDFYIIPLAKKLKNCGVFGKSSDEYLHYAELNRAEWAKKGESIVAGYLEEIEKQNAEQDVEK